MDKVEELKKLTKDVLGNGPGACFHARADKMIEDAAWSNTSLLSATKEIERLVNLFIGVEYAGLLKKKYREFFRDHPAYI